MRLRRGRRVWAGWCAREGGVVERSGGSKQILSSFKRLAQYKFDYPSRNPFGGAFRSLAPRSSAPPSSVPPPASASTRAAHMCAAATEFRCGSTLFSRTQTRSKNTCKRHHRTIPESTRRTRTRAVRIPPWLSPSVTHKVVQARRPGGTQTPLPSSPPAPERPRPPRAPALYAITNGFQQRLSGT